MNPAIFEYCFSDLKLFLESFKGIHVQENEGDVLWNCLGLRRGAGEDKNYPPQCTVSAKFPTRLDYHILSTEKHVFIIGFTDYLFNLFTG